MTFEPAILDLAHAVLQAAREKRVLVATAESCTGGLVAAALTEIAGSSDVLDRGFVTYSNEAKVALLGVPEPLLARHGAVSEAVARAMAEGALARSLAGAAVAVTGIAGPGGGSPAKPVGRVHVAAAAHGGRCVHEQLDFGDIGRGAVRTATLRRALDLLRHHIESNAS
jgi:nicotinamide-nucleotide amidase